MPPPRSSTARAKSPATPAGTKTPARKTAAPSHGGSANGLSPAAAMLREIQIDGKALSMQIERLSRRFL